MAGVTSVRPSTADSTEIAGVITESPRNIAAPITPSSSTSGVRRPSARVASAVSDSVPPSPLLSARSRISTYLSVTTTISAHRIMREHAEHGVAGDRAGFGRRHHRHAEGVERARADVAIDHADAAERQRPETRAGMRSRRRPGRPGGWASPAMSVMESEAWLSLHRNIKGRVYTPPRRKQQRQPSNVAAENNPGDQGFRLTGIGGASRISVMVTRRLAATKGSSGNSGCVSARPATM